MMTEQQFKDWFNEEFGNYGYGDGELYTIPALQEFMQCCPMEGNYDHEAIGRTVGPTITWLLMNVLCAKGIITYGTSPRFGWLTEEGKSLKQFLATKTKDELYELVMGHSG